MLLETSVRFTLAVVGYPIVNADPAAPEKVMPELSTALQNINAWAYEWLTFTSHLGRGL